MTTPPTRTTGVGGESLTSGECLTSSESLTSGECLTSSECLASGDDATQLTLA
jgi:hypothetical protein